MATETIQVTYLMEAVDRASKTIEALDEKLKKYEKNLEKTEQTTKGLEKEQLSLIDKLKMTSQTFLNVSDKVKQFTHFLANMNLKKIILSLALLSAALRFKGFDFLADMVSKANGFILKFGLIIKESASKLLIFQENLGGVLGTIAGFSVLDYIKEKLTALSKVFVAGTAIASGFFLAMSNDKINLIVINFLARLDTQLIKTSINLIKLEKDWPKMAGIAEKSLNLIRSGLGKFTSAFTNGGLAVTDMTSKINTAATETRTLGKGFVDAIKHTEAFEKGIFGLATRLSLFAGGFAILGAQLLQTDSVLLKMSGVTLLAFAAALGGIVVVIRQFIVGIGQFIQDVGEGMVKASQKSVEKMIKLEKATFAYSFVLNNLNKETQGATGSLEEWNNVIDEFTNKTGFSVEETQNAVSEMLRFGHSIGLTKKQMKTLLPVIGDLAVANHKGLFTSTLAVVEALAGQTVMLQNMGVNLTEHAVLHSEVGKELDENYRKLNDHEKAQVRYNLLLDKSTVIQGIAADSLRTTTGAIRRQESAWDRISAAIGVGANIVESQFNIQYGNLINLLEGSSGAFLGAIGFIQSLAGRVLQIIGLVTKWSFTLVLLGSSLAAINTFIKAGNLGKYLNMLAKSVLVTQTLANANSGLANTISVGLQSLAKWGASMTSLGAIFISVMKGTVLAAAPFVLILLKITAIFAGIILIAYGFKKAFDEIEEKTKFFSKTWEYLVNLFKESSPVMEAIKEALSFVGDFLLRLGKAAVKILAADLLILYSAFLKIVEVAKNVGFAIYDFGVASVPYIKAFYQVAKESFLNLIDTIKNFISNGIKKLKDAFSEELEVIGNVVQYVIDFIVTSFEKAKKAIQDFIDIGAGKFEKIKKSASDFADKAKTSVVNFAKDAKSKFTEIGTSILNNIGFQSAYSEEISKTTKETDKTNKAIGDRNKGLIEHQKNINGVINSLKSEAVAEFDIKKAVEAKAKAQTAANNKHGKELKDVVQNLKDFKKVVEEPVLLFIDLEKGDLTKWGESVKKFFEGISFDKVINDIKNISFEDVLSGAKKAMSFIWDTITFNPIEAFEKNFKGITDIIKKGGKDIAALGSGVFKAMSSGKKGAEALITGVAKGLGTAFFGPIGGAVMENVIGPLMSAPDEFAAQIEQFFESLPNLISNILINGIRFDEFFINGLKAMVQQFPAIVEDLTNVVVTKFADPTFQTSLIFSLASAILKSIAVVPEAFARGVRDGLQNAIDNSRDFIQKAFNVFKVIKASIKDALEDSGVGEFLSKVFNPLFEKLKSFWELFKNMIEDMLVNPISKIGDILKKGLDPVLNLFSEKLLSPLSKIGDLLKTAFLSIYDFMPSIVKDFGNLLLDAVRTAFSKVGSIFTKIFKIDGGGTGPVERLLGFDFPFVKFSKGGIVGGREVVRGDSEMNDRIPALLSAGEIVLPKSAVGGGISGILSYLNGLGLNKAKVGGLDMAEYITTGKPIKRGLGSLFKKVGGFLGDLATGVFDTIKGAAGAGINIVTGAIEAPLDLPKTTYDELAKVGLMVGQRFDLPFVDDAIELISSLLRIGLKVNPVSISDNILTGNIKGYVSGLLKESSSVFDPYLKQILQAPKAQNGMIVPGQQRSGDKVLVRTNSGEMILNQQQQANLFDMIRNGGGGGGQVIELTTYVQLDERQLAKSMERIELNGWAR